MIDRKRVERSFHRGASEYDEHTPVQKRVLDSLLEKLAQRILSDPSRLLDIGCGTGLLLEQLSKKYSETALTGIDIAPNMLVQATERLAGGAQILSGDAEELPFPANNFDLVLSSSVFQWLEQCGPCFEEVHRVLAKGGLFSFALFGQGTFMELHEAWRIALGRCGRAVSPKFDGTHHFHSVDDIRVWLASSGFSDIRVESVKEVVWYDDLPQLLRAIKRVGAGSSRPPSGGGLGWRTVLHEMAAVYAERFGRDKGVPASYEVIYGSGTA